MSTSHLERWVFDPRPLSESSESSLSKSVPLIAAAWSKFQASACR